MSKKDSENKEMQVVVELVMENNQPMVSSVMVAERFEKQHKDVLKAIRNLEIPDEFSERNFAPTSIDVAQPNGGTRKERSFNMTRDGFSLLAMGFTGHKAMEWKIKFLEAFNAMEARLTIPPAEGKLLYKKAKPEAVRAFEGVARYWCFLEGISWEQGKRQIEGVVRVPDLYEMDALAMESAWTYLRMCMRIVPPKMRGKDICSKKELSPVNGLLDYWAYCGKSSRDELLGILCEDMCIDSLECLPKSYVPHAVSIIWEGINNESGRNHAQQEASY
ncbi:Rha family transcriptional regulator [Maridesulfovibrio sp.]|uniref:Rha family transcriptional regulator n=1 Tax=Maridesulfovibrio sp. TaxID=2795000 RepID=UPI0029F56641|nr:Rha family transcriptional regulator [Maridesulfovibrio sp.]